MISINENKLYQWDTARVIRCTPPEGMRIDEIHVDNHTRKNAIVLDVYEESGYICANIPDVCLQKPHPLHVYAVMKIDGEENTIESETFTVIPRKKPEDYVYEEEEILRYSKLEEQINALNEKVDNLDVPEVEVDDSLSKESINPVQNKVVTEAVKGLEKKIDDIEIPEVPQTDSELSETSTNPIQNQAVTEAIKAVEEKVEDVDLSKKFTAVPGQVVCVKAVDEKGNPTEWEATDITSGEENVQSDLSENDENSAAYVKNRTHWIGKKTGVVWEEMTVPSGNTPIKIPCGVNIVEGETYTVTFNGTEYVYPDLKYYNADVPYALGNLAVTGDEEGTGEQFVIMIPPSSISEQQGIYGLIFNKSEAEATISVKGTYPFIYTLDEKFLPDSVKSQADYAQNDETASDYIKNRTHYEVTELLVEETSVTVTSNSSTGSVLYDAFDVDLIEGDTYIVTFDGTEYECVATLHPEMNVVCIGASDASFYDVCYNITKHTPPFLYATHTNMHSLYAEGTHTISITHIALKKLDNKFLNDDVFTQADFLQNDLSALDYIKNRTHWIEEDVKLSVNNFEGTQTYYGIMSSDGSSGVRSAVGDLVIVYYDDVRYDCIMKQHYSWPDDEMAGNASISDPEQEDTGEPFYLSSTGGRMFVKANDDEQHKLVIALPIYHPLSPKFLPNGGVTSWDDLEGRPFYSEYEEAEILPETTVELDPDSGMSPINKLGLVAGLTYTVKWNSTETEYICKEMLAEGVLMGVGLGNVEAMAETGDSGDTFAIVDFTVDGQELMGVEAVVVDLTGATSVTFSVSGIKEIVHLLDKKYLPPSELQLVINATQSIYDKLKFTSDKSIFDILKAIEDLKYVVVKVTKDGKNMMFHLESYDEEEVKFYRMYATSDSLKLQILRMSIDTTETFTMETY